jgi:hypothetical protein
MFDEDIVELALKEGGNGSMRGEGIEGANIGTVCMPALFDLSCELVGGS